MSARSELQRSAFHGAGAVGGEAATTAVLSHLVLRYIHDHARRQIRRRALAITDGLERIDLLFTNVIMPGGLNGRQLATEALKRRGNSRCFIRPVIRRTPSSIMAGLNAGVLLLPKPYLSSDLERMIPTSLAS